MRVPVDEFLALDLEVHDFLADVPLRDVSAVDLMGGGAGRTLSDVRDLLSKDRPSPGVVVRLLFAVRYGLGRIFGWDRHPAPGDDSYLVRLSDDHLRRTLVPPGTTDGPFRVLYVFPGEGVNEARNATVHAFSCMALRPATSGYRLYWAVYVKPVSAFTPIYMAAIEPFRRFVVYPRILRGLRDAWEDRFPTTEPLGLD